MNKTPPEEWARYKIRKMRILSVDPKFSYGFPEGIIVLSAKKKLGRGLEILYLEQDMEETEAVWVVFKRGAEGDSFYAICRSEKIAEKARTKLAAVLGEVETHFEVQEIARDAVHPFGILCMDSSVDIK